MERFSDFILIIKDFIQLFGALTEVEQTKLNAAVENKISFVEECMNKEQAAILRLRGLEQRREKAQKELGMEGAAFREILEQVSEEEEKELRPLFQELSEKVERFQSVSDSAKDIIEVNLHTIKKHLDATGAPIKKDSVKEKNTHFKSRSV